ncbi:MAG: hypothetical protein A3B68_04120 [Candidatus Melainabacteria bacterium RIFCSPHIGHO2_02_FULL_34_12]|nr:MAG: hypothetical protein A3B68_04120 [Candidatus Melainabacteria bacterium RIFCSPHIGHO2_02_FULL_34_12]
MSKNNSKRPDKLELIHKAIMAGIGATTSKEKIRKTAMGIYDDIQKIITGLLKDLESKGKLKAKEAKSLLKDLQKKSEVEKIKIYKKLQKEGKSLFKSTRNIVLTPLSALKEITSSLTKSTNGRKKASKSKTKRKKKK